MNRQGTQDHVLHDFLRLLRRQWWLILALTLVAVAAGVAYSSQKTPVYEASTQLQFNDQGEALSLVGTPVFPSSTPTVQAAAAARVVTSPEVLRRVQHALRKRLPAPEVQSSVETAVDPSTNLVTVTTSAGNAKLAARLANEFAHQAKVVATRTQRATFLRAADRVQRTIKQSKPERQPKRKHPSAVERALNASNAQGLSRLRSLAGLANPVTIVSPATVPSDPVSPKPIRDALLALALGLTLGLLAAFVRDSLDRRLTDAHDIQHQLQLPMVGYVESDVLGGVGFTKNGTKKAPDSGIEGFRILRSNVEFLAPEKTLRTVAVTSPVAEEGKSTVAAGLAIASALAGKRVLLLECDLRRPVLAERLNLSSQPGLTDWLTGSAQPADVVRPVQIEQYIGAAPAAGGGAEPAVNRLSLAAVIAGTWSPQPTELLASTRFRDLLTQVAQVYDLIVLDLAPLLPVGDALEVLQLVDAALVCIRVDQTTREQAHAAKAAIEHLPPRPTGVVITGVRPGREGYYYGYYSSEAAQPRFYVSPVERG